MVSDTGNQCGCGCGGLTNGSNRFINGHYGRITNKGKHHSEETKKKISLGNIGKRLSEETRKKLSLAKLGKKLKLSPEARLSQTIVVEYDMVW